MRVDGSKAQVDFGEGVLREVNVTLVEAKVGDYVETLALWKEILAAGEE
jgi:hydrogenase maturation factor